MIFCCVEKEINFQKPLLALGLVERKIVLNYSTRICALLVQKLHPNSKVPHNTIIDHPESVED